MANFCTRVTMRAFEGGPVTSLSVYLSPRNTSHAKDKVEASCKITLKNLQVWAN